MEKTLEILKHLNDLYTEHEMTEQEAYTYAQKNKERYSAWEDAFKDYDLPDVFKAIDEYWRFQSNKTKPTVAKILAMLNTAKDIEKLKEDTDEKFRYFNIESELSVRDRELNRNQDYYYPDYKRAVEWILSDGLIELMGATEYKKLSKKDKAEERGDKYAIAMKNELFDKFDDILRKVNPPRFNASGVKNIDFSNIVKRMGD